MDEKIEVECRCGVRLRTSAGNAGRRARCPRCGKRVLVPTGPLEPMSASRLLRAMSEPGGSRSQVKSAAFCPCGQRVYEPGDREGQVVVCPVCLRRLRLQSLREQRRTWKGLPAVR